MKTAIYIEDGLIQLVLTPENTFEVDTLRSFAKQRLALQINEGSFYGCNGGWIRHGSEDCSLIIRLVTPQEPDKGAQPISPLPFCSKAGDLDETTTL